MSFIVSTVILNEIRMVKKNFVVGELFYKLFGDQLAQMVQIQLFSI